MRNLAGVNANHLLSPSAASGLLVKSSRTVKPRPSACWEPSGLGDNDTSSRTTTVLSSRRDVWKYRTYRTTWVEKYSYKNNMFRMSIGISNVNERDLNSNINLKQEQKSKIWYQIVVYAGHSSPRKTSKKSTRDLSPNQTGMCKHGKRTYSAPPTCDIFQSFFNVQYIAIPFNFLYGNHVRVMAYKQVQIVHRPLVPTGMPLSINSYRHSSYCSRGNVNIKIYTHIGNFGSRDTELYKRLKVTERYTNYYKRNMGH